MTEKNERVSDTEVQERENGLYQRESMKREREGKGREEQEKTETGRKKIRFMRLTDLGRPNAWPDPAAKTQSMA
jgi:hypothetical protein